MQNIQELELKPLLLLSKRHFIFKRNKSVIHHGCAHYITETMCILNHQSQEMSKNPMLQQLRAFRSENCPLVSLHLQIL